MEILVNSIIQKIIHEFFLLLLAIIGLLIIGFKSWSYFNSFRIYSIFRIYLNKNKLKNHPIFFEINFIKENLDFVNSVMDSCRKELILSTVYLDIKFSKLFLKSLCMFLFKKNFINFLKFSINSLTVKNLVEHIQREHKILRNEMPDFLRNKLKDFMTENDFNTFIEIYLEQTEVFFLVFQKDLELIKNQKNLYTVILNILDSYLNIISVYKQIIARQILKANGRLSGIKFKGYIAQ